MGTDAPIRAIPPAAIAPAIGSRLARWLLLSSTLALVACGTGNRTAPIDSRTQVKTATPPAAAAQRQGEYVTDDGVVVRALGAGELSATPLPSAAGARSSGDGGAALSRDTTAAPRSPTSSQGQPSRNPAVKALLAEADLAGAAGDQSRAAASIERALKVEPRNAWLWHRLAQVRLDQGQLRNAENLAARSRALAPGDAVLQTRSWQLIARARDALGDGVGANQALAQAAQYQ